MTDLNAQSLEQRAPRSSDLGGVMIDLAAVIGLSSITFGVWQIYEPAAYIVGGAMLLMFAWFAARRGVAE